MEKGSFRIMSDKFEEFNKLMDNLNRSKIRPHYREIIERVSLELTDAATNAATYKDISEVMKVLDSFKYWLEKAQENTIGGLK